MMPPLMTVGSKLPASSSAATSDVVVVLPWVPAMATHDFRRISSASISARRHIGVLAEIAALHPVTEIVQHLGDAAHPDAADSDEMNRPCLTRHLHAKRSLRV